MMVLHGANDTHVPVVEAQQIVENLRSPHVPVEYILFPDEGHGWRKVPNRIRSAVAITEFSVKHLGVSSPDRKGSASGRTAVPDVVSEGGNAAPGLTGRSRYAS